MSFSDIGSHLAGWRLIESSDTKQKKPTWRNPEGFRHVGLLSIAPTSISRFTLYIVVRDLSNCLVEWPKKAFGTHHILTRALVLFVAANTRGFGPYFGDYDDMRKNIREKASILFAVAIDTAYLSV